MQLPNHKTKIVCTVGPACSSVPVIEEMIRNGMDVARLNFSHGLPEEKAKDMEKIYEAARRTGRIVTILADLPGTKIRVGKLAVEPRNLAKGESIVLTVRENPSPELIPVEYPQLPKSVRPGGTIFLNDGFIELRVEDIAGDDVRCTVVVGGPLLSHKGLNLPGAHLFVDPVTERDLELITFGVKAGLDTFGVSFVEKAEDIIKIRKHAAKLGASIRIVAKIERGEAVRNFDEILELSDGIMIARGDLGVEIPIEDVPVVQKQLIQKANLLGKPVITATQMLESMKANTRPTRAEVSDVANAILDGTDAIMLSEETAIGKYPVETVKMMASIAAATERRRSDMAAPQEWRWYLKTLAGQGKLTIPDVISRNVVVAADVLKTRYILTPTETGSTARRVSRFKPDCWIMAFSPHQSTCRFMALSYGVFPLQLVNNGGSWHQPVIDILKKEGLSDPEDTVIITEGRFLNLPGGTDSMGIITVE